MAQFYTLEEAARVLGISSEELKTQAQSRKVRAFMDSGSWRFRVADVDELARRRGMGSDPDLSLSDLDLVSQPQGASDSVADLDLSEFQLGVASPDLANMSMDLNTGDSDSDILLDDRSLPPENLTGSSSTIIGMRPAGKQPSDSDVRLVPDQPGKGASDSDVRLGNRPVGRSAPPSDSDVTLVSNDFGSGSSDAFPAGDPGETTLRPSPMIGSSGEVTAADHEDSDFELTPSSVIDALEPESGSDFELTALDASDEFDATPRRGPGDSDVTASEPAASGINLGRPSDSGINLQSVGGFNLDSADSIELAPLDDEAGQPQRPAPKAKPPAAKPAAPKVDPGATAMPQKVDLSATALPMKADKDIFEDTDFEVDALDSGGDDRTMQLEATSDFDLDESDSASEVFAVDEDDVDQAAATAMGPAVLDDDEGFGDDAAEPVSGETDSAWDVEPEATPSQVAASPRGGSPLLQAGGAQPEWGGLWVGMLGVATVFMMLLGFVGMDLIRNLYDFNGDGPASGLIKSIAGLMGG